MNKKSQQDQEEYIDLGQIARSLWNHIVLILLIGIIFAVLLFGYSRFFLTPQYEANTLFYVNNSTFSLSNAVAISTGELSAASELVDTYVAILESRANMELVISQSGVDYTYEEVRRMISAKAVNSTGLFQVSVTSSNPEEARTIANTIASILPDKVSDIVANSSVEIVDYAVTPHSRVSPSYIKYAAIGLLLGMVLCSAIIILRDFMDDVIHDQDYLLQNYQVPVLATIPDLTAKTPKKYGYYGSGSYAKAANKGGVD
ncbi:MAG: hypothetical protein K6C08_02920 [Oscillospiraceae bacterium]|nr:hypothetical protein [Oscillospiraceae bacterium]